MVVSSFSCPRIFCTSATFIPRSNASVAVVCRIRCGYTLLSIPERSPIFLTIDSIPSFFSALTGLRSVTKRAEQSPDLENRYFFKATSALALIYDILCLLPLPKRCTSPFRKSTSVFLRIANSDTRQPVL